MHSPRGQPEAANATVPRHAVDFDRYIPTVLSRVMARLRSSANEFFGERYGISLLEWRIISFLAAQGPSSAYAIWTEGALDKAAATRAIRSLRDRGLCTVNDVAGHKRRKTAVALTPQGLAIHEATFGEVVTRHQRLLQGLSTEAVTSFMATLAHIDHRIDTMADGPTEPGPDFLPTKIAVAASAAAEALPGQRRQADRRRQAS